jgi:hypothetical protein
MTDFAQHGIYDASLNAFPSVRRYVYAKNVSQNDASLVPKDRDAFWLTAGG